MSNHVPSIHDSFNARTLTTKALAECFILNDYFPQLAGQNHSIMIGPRGSGKTTLMKMLQVEALEFWNSPEAEDSREKINFSGVFVPTDRLWKKQYDKLKSEIENDHEKTNYLNSIFIYHVLERLISTLEFRVSKIIPKSNSYRKSNLSKNHESELVSELSESWGLQPKTLSLKSLEIEILRKKNELSNSVTNTSNFNVSVPTSFRLNQIVSILDLATKIINSYLNEKGEKWCFLFDELELAPENVIQPLIEALRGGPDDIIFKLSMSPYHGNINISGLPTSPMTGQDHVVINLSNSRPASGYDFSRKLCSQILKKNNLNDDIESYFEKPLKFEIKNTFIELSNKDSIFNQYLIDNKIIPEDLHLYTDKDKLPTVRKIQFVAYLRNHYVKKIESGKVKLSSKKRAPDYYAGFKNLCKAMEYNPRMLIGMTNMFVETLNSGKDKIQIHEQINILEKTLRSFRALLNTISVDIPKIETIDELISKIASHCETYIKGRKFYPEPYGSFKFNKEPPENLKKAIGLALNAGALIIEDANKSYVEIIEMKGLSCRLSFLFSHEHGLLMTTPRETNFESIFQDGKIEQLGLLV